MTTVQIDLPDALAREAKDAGLLSAESIAQMLQDRLGQARRRREVRAALDADPLPEMTDNEINAEIAAYRAETRRASGS